MVAALVREVREETGLVIQDARFVLAQDCVHSSEFYKPAHFVLLNFSCQSPGGEVMLNDEAQSYQWVTAAEARALPLNSFTRVLVDAVHPA